MACGLWSANPSERTGLPLLEIETPGAEACLQMRGNWQRWGLVEFMCVNLRCSHEFHVKVSSRQFGIRSCKNQEGNTDLGVIYGDDIVLL